MKIYDFDNTMFIKLGDLDHLLRQMCREKKGLSDVFGPMMDRILESRCKACEDEEEIEALCTRVENQFYKGKFIVVIRPKQTDPEKPVAKRLYFRKFCTEIQEAKWREEGKTEEEIDKLLVDYVGEPVFTENVLDAEYFEEYGFASSTAGYLNHNYEMSAKVDEAYMHNPKAIQRIKEMFMEWDKERLEEKAKEKKEEEA